MSFSAASLRAVLDSHAPGGIAGFVVALSGGADSAALLAGMAALRHDPRALPLRAVHIDHGLQTAAAQFRDACSALCRQLRVPLRIISIDIDSPAGISVEAAARDARYAALAAQLAPKECLLTAHHRKDQAETLVLQALRGAGVKGMSAMPMCRIFGAGWHVRPLLDVPQSELLAFGAHLAQFRSPDPMNEDLRFDRTFLRRQVWPMIEDRWPGMEIALSRTARHMADTQRLLDSAAAADLARLRDGEALSIQALRSLPPLRRMNAVRLWLCEAQAQAPSMARLSEALRQVLDADVDRMPRVVWGNAALRRYRQRLFLTEADPPRLREPQAWSANSGASLSLGQRLGTLTLVAQIGGIALNQLPVSLIVRRRAGGEALRPARLAKTHSVQHLCQSQGVLPWMRDALPLVFAGDALIAVADLWLDARWCVAADAPGVAIQWHGAPLIV
jgi:tRNA(Ile)-lysidine synthase